MFAVDPQAKMREARAKRGRLAVQVGVRDMPHVLSPVVVARSQHLAPTGPMGIATCAQHFERRGNANDIDCLAVAPAFLPFDRQPNRVHRVWRKRQIDRPRIEGLGEAHRRVAQRRRVWPIGERIGRVVSLTPFLVVGKLRSTLARVDLCEQCGRVDDRHFAIKRCEDRGDCPRASAARIVIVRPDEHAPAGERSPIRLSRRIGAGARCRRDGLGENAVRRVRLLQR